MGMDNGNKQLIDDLLGNTAEIEQILALVRKEKAVRRKRRTLAQSFAILLLVAGFLVVARKPDTASESAVQNESFSLIRFIGEEELFELLGDQPLAIIHGANNTRHLVLIDQSTGGDQLRQL